MTGIGTAIGTWALTMKTPMGEQTGNLIVTDDGAHMVNPEGAVDQLIDFTAQGNAMSWKVQVTKPMPLKLHFQVEIDGDTLSGKFRPGMFPPSPVTGVRV